MTIFKKVLLLFLLCIPFSVIAQINTDRVMLMGRNALYYEDYVLSIQRFNMVIGAKPYLAEPYFYRALAKFYLEDYWGAETDCSEAIERNPFLPDNYRLRGLCRINLKNYGGAVDDNCMILCDTSLEDIFKNIQDVRPEIVVIDSIQTISTDSVDSSPGSVTQVRECASALLRFAKSSGIPVILIGHINKEGTLAGPKILEHIVDTVIQFEGDQHYMYRILRSTKNRFGSTSELGIYEMGHDGLRQVANPSELLLTQDHDGLSGIAISSAIEGVRPFLVETQALVSSAAYGTPQRSATGFDQRRLNMLLAVLEKRVGFKLMQKDVFLNIAGGLRVTDMAMDLSVIAAVLSSNVDTAIEAGWCMAGEVGLSGEVRPVNRIEQRISEAEKLGFTHIILPKYNLQGIVRKKFNIEIVPVRKVEEALRALFG